MIHGEVFQKLIPFALSRTPSPHCVDRALQERAPRERSAFSKGSGFSKSGDGFAVKILRHGLSLQKDIQGASSPVCLFGATRFLL
jgi:hypothetical protein